MDSPILRPVPSPKREIVFGHHTTKYSAAVLTVAGIGIRTGDARDNQLSIQMMRDPTIVKAGDLRELAQLFAEMADILDGK